MGFADENCRLVIAGEKPLSDAAAKEFLKEIPKWTLSGNTIEREFSFKTFRHGIDFLNSVADLAEEQQHHPDILVSYTKIKFILSTHKIGGLSGNDFIIAAKIDRLFEAGNG